MRIQDNPECAYEPVTESGCWIWTKCISSSGYGQIRVDGKMMQAHRFMYAREYGPIPDGICILHKCDTPSCVNPYHLFKGTQKENVADCVKKGRRQPQNGDNNTSRKLSSNDAIAIFLDTRKHRVIAKDYEVNRSTVTDIKNKRSWANITSGIRP